MVFLDGRMLELGVLPTMLMGLDSLSWRYWDGLWMRGLKYVALLGPVTLRVLKPFWQCWELLVLYPWDMGSKLGGTYSVRLSHWNQVYDLYLGLPVCIPEILVLWIIISTPKLAIFDMQYKWNIFDPQTWPFHHITQYFHPNIILYGSPVPPDLSCLSYSSLCLSHHCVSLRP